jgi:hypothetical protein
MMPAYNIFSPVYNQDQEDDEANLVRVKYEIDDLKVSE